MAGKAVWVVLHCEVFLTPESSVVDEVVAFVASSRRKARSMMKSHIPDRGTWWRLECARVDDDDGTSLPSALYSRDGRVLKSAPEKAGYRASLLRFRRALAAMKEHLAKMRKNGESRKAIRLRSSAIRSMSRTLAGHS